MIKNFVDAWNANKEAIRATWLKECPCDYESLVKGVVSFMPDMDPERVHEIDDGDYQGTLVYIIAAQGYQPSTYWCVKVSYGSCSGCDTLQDLQTQPLNDRIDGMLTLGLHIVQGLRSMFHDKPAD